MRPFPSVAGVSIDSGTHNFGCPSVRPLTLTLTLTVISTYEGDDIAL